MIIYIVTGITHRIPVRVVYLTRIRINFVVVGRLGHGIGVFCIVGCALAGARRIPIILRPFSSPLIQGHKSAHLARKITPLGRISGRSVWRQRPRRWARRRRCGYREWWKWERRKWEGYSLLAARISIVYRIVSDICVDSPSRRISIEPAAFFPLRFSRLWHPAADTLPVSSAKSPDAMLARGRRGRQGESAAKRCECSVDLGLGARRAKCP